MTFEGIFKNNYKKGSNYLVEYNQSLNEVSTRKKLEEDNWKYKF
jgi:hypothetical protein